MKDVDLETITDALSWYKFWQLNGFNHIRAKQKTSQETEKSLRKFLEPQHKPTKVIPTYKSLEFGKSAKTFPGIIARLHLTVQKQMGLLKERYARLKKGLLLFCCNQVWMKNGGRIPWSVTAICETCKISCLMRKHLTNGDSANQLKDQ